MTSTLKKLHNYKEEIKLKFDYFVKNTPQTMGKAKDWDVILGGELD